MIVWLLVRVIDRLSVEKKQELQRRLIELLRTPKYGGRRDA